MPNDYEGNSSTRLLHAWSTTHTHGILHHGCHYITHGMPITYIHYSVHSQFSYHILLFAIICSVSLQQQSIFWGEFEIIRNFDLYIKLQN